MANQEWQAAHLTSVRRARGLRRGVISMADKATFGAGCFWGVEAAFQRVPGVIDTAVGYSGGETQNPTYKGGCTGETGQARGVQITFEPTSESYEQLPDACWQ